MAPTEVAQALGVGHGFFTLLNFGAGVTTFLGFQAFFGKLEDMASPQAKRDISAWLKNTSVSGHLSTWPRQFATLFDNVFGRKHWSLRCFFRSCVASIFAVVIMVVAWSLINPLDAATLFARHPMQELYDQLTPDQRQYLATSFAGRLCFSTGIIAGIIILLSLISIVPDFVSLLESRYMIRLMERTKRTYIIGTLVISDLLLTITIFLTFILVYSGFRAFSAPGEFNENYEFVVSELFNSQNYVHLFSLKGMVNGGVPASVFFYSTLFTSVWVWLYAISIFTIRAANSAGPLFRWVMWFLDIDEKPIRSIGAIAGLIAAVGWWGIVLISGRT